MLTTLPYDIKAKIAFFVADIDGLSGLANFFLTCRAIHDELLGNPDRGLPANHALLADIFEHLFDTKAVVRRVTRGQRLTSDITSAELKKRSKVLCRIKAGGISGEELLDDLLVVYLMLLEDDGKNMHQLRNVGVRDWAIRVLIYTVSHDVNGWPVETEISQLSAAIVALLSSHDDALHEDPEVSAAIVNALRPYFVAAHRYPVAHFPITRRNFDSDAIDRPELPPHTLLNLATLPIYAPLTLTHFGRNVTMALPLASESAICGTYIRFELRDQGWLPSTPLTRAEADARGWVWGATQADWKLSNLLRRLGLGVEVRPAGSADENPARLEDPMTGSERFDIDWDRMVYTHPDPTLGYSVRRSWFITVYRVGILTGRWIGRYTVPGFNAHTRMLVMHPASLTVVDGTLEEDEGYHHYQPFAMRLREHIAVHVTQHVAVGRDVFGDNVANAWFPSELDYSRGRGMRDTGTELVVRDPHEPVEAWATKRYQTWHPGMQIPQAQAPAPFPLVSPAPFAEDEQNSIVEDDTVPPEVEMDFEEEGVPLPRSYRQHPEAPDQEYVEYDDLDDDDSDVDVDVLITGETDYETGKAWGAYKIYGRVRRQDGLIVLVRAPINPADGLGRWIFRGYLRAGATIVGRWRETAMDITQAGYEGTFVLSKVGETFGIEDTL